MAGARAARGRSRAARRSGITDQRRRLGVGVLGSRRALRFGAPPLRTLPDHKPGPGREDRRGVRALRRARRHGSFLAKWPQPTELEPGAERPVARCRIERPRPAQTTLQTANPQEEGQDRSALRTGRSRGLGRENAQFGARRRLARDLRPDPRLRLVPRHARSARAHGPNRTHPHMDGTQRSEDRAAQTRLLLARRRSRDPPARLRGAGRNTFALALDRPSRRNRVRDQRFRGQLRGSIRLISKRRLSDTQDNEISRTSRPRGNPNRSGACSPRSNAGYSTAVSIPAIVVDAPTSDVGGISFRGHRRIGS